MTRALLIAPLVAVCACTQLPSNGFAIDLTITQGSVSREEIQKTRTLELSAIGSENATRTFTLEKPFESGEERVIYRPRVLDGVIQFTAIAKLIGGTTLASGQVAVRINPFNTAHATISLAPGLVTLGDMGVAPQDMAGLVQDLRRADLSTFRSCNLLTQQPCSSTEKCTFDDNLNGYCAANGSVGVAGQCTRNAATHDNCSRGYVCLSRTGTTTNWCMQFCSTNADCTQPAAIGGVNNIPRCVGTIENSATKVCSVACNPLPTLGASGCASLLKCDWGYDNGSQYTDCIAVGAGIDGSPCTTNGPRDCMSGFSCPGNVCRPVCRIGQNDCTTIGYTCVAPPTSLTTSPMFGWCCPSGVC